MPKNITFLTKFIAKASLATGIVLVQELLPALARLVTQVKQKNLRGSLLLKALTDQVMEAAETCLTEQHIRAQPKADQHSAASL